MNFIMDTQIDKAKLNFGLAFYGHSLNLTNSNQHNIGSPIDGNAEGGEILHDKGVMAYYEVNL